MEVLVVAELSNQSSGHNWSKEGEGNSGWSRSWEWRETGTIKVVVPPKTEVKNSKAILVKVEEHQQQKQKHKIFDMTVKRQILPFIIHM